MRKLWTNEEISILIGNFSNVEHEILLELLPNKSKTAILMKAKKMGLRRNPEITKTIKSRNMSGNKNPMYGKVGANKGKVVSEDTKEKLRQSHLGKEGLKGDANPMYGKEPYNKGKKMEDYLTKEKCIQIKNILSIKAKERWENLTDKEKEFLKLNNIKKCLSKVKKSDTKPELITESILTSLNINFEKQGEFKYYTCDFVIGNKIIEVQGDYWHANPEKYTKLNKTQRKNVGRDKAKKSYLTKRGYEILYLWEYDLYRNIEKCKELIINFLLL